LKKDGTAYKRKCDSYTSKRNPPCTWDPDEKKCYEKVLSESKEESKQQESKERESPRKRPCKGLRKKPGGKKPVCEEQDHCTWTKGKGCEDKKVNESKEQESKEQESKEQESKEQESKEQESKEQDISTVIKIQAMIRGRAARNIAARKRRKKRLKSKKKKKKKKKSSSDYSDYFIGSYPQISTVREFNPEIWRRKEFHKGGEYAGLKSHQRLIQRYTSPVTPYDEVLLFHAMGSGKTRSALSAAENALAASSSGSPVINRVFVVGKTSKNVRIIFTEELKKMLRARLGVDKLTEDQKSKLEKHIKNRYKFLSYGTMGSGSSPYSIGGKSVFSLLKLFDKSMFILDEAHNLTTDVGESQKQSIWKRFQKLFDILPNRKIILLSGTPMINQSKDIIPLLNLILPPGKKMTKKKPLLKQLRSAIVGRVSYVKEDIAGDLPKAVYDGVLSSPMQNFKLVYLAMSPFQSAAYRQALVNSQQGDETTFDLELQRAALFAFPSRDGGVGSVADWTQNGKLRSSFWEELKTDGKFDIKKLCKFSCKFAEVVKAAETGPWPIYVYSNIVEGSRFKNSVSGAWENTVSGAGLKLLSLILEKWGFYRFKSSSTSKRKRYVYFTGSSSDRPSASVINLFNAPGRNSNGEICRVVLGSEASSEGYTFRNVKREIVLTPHHHYAQIAQALARGIRVGAHDRGDNVRGAGRVHISRLAAVPVPSDKKIKCGSQIKDQSVLNRVSEKNNIDVRMYKRSEKKDIEIKHVENMIKRYAFDCAFNFDINSRPDGDDDSRDCDYKECAYKCKGMQKYEAEDEMGYVISENQLVDYTWNKYYAPNISAQIKNQFRTVDQLSVNNLAEVLDLAPVVVLNALSEIIENREPVASRSGKLCYLCSYGENIFLTFDIVEPVGISAVSALYYVQNPVTHTAMTNREYIKTAKYNNAKRNLRDYLNNPDQFLQKDNALCGNCPNISTLPLLLQEKLLETAVAYIRKHRNTPRQNTNKFDLALKIKLYYSMALFEVKDVLVSALLFTFGNSTSSRSSLRMFENSAWKDASDEVLTEYKRKYEFTPRKRAALNDKSYGLYNYTSCTFCIVEPSKNKKKSAKTLNMGRNAYTFNQKALVQIFEKENIDAAGVKVDETFFDQDNAYFPWIGGTAQPEINPNKSMDKQAKPVLSGLLLLAWKKQDKIYLDKNCGVTEKKRVKASGNL
jgi:hypothetical protein